MFHSFIHSDKKKKRFNFSQWKNGTKINKWNDAEKIEFIIRKSSLLAFKNTKKRKECFRSITRKNQSNHLSIHSATIHYPSIHLSIHLSIHPTIYPNNIHSFNHLLSNSHYRHGTHPIHAQLDSFITNDN